MGCFRMCLIVYNTRGIHNFLMKCLMFHLQCMNFDGAPKFKSSCVSIWPVQLYMNELPPHLR